MIETFIPLILPLAVAGIAAGLLAGLLGVGGGIIMVPALIYVLSSLGYSDSIITHVAVATSLAVIVPTGLSSLLAHYKRGVVDIPTLKLWGPALIVGALVGSLVSRYMSGDSLRTIFGVMILFVAINMFVPVQRKMAEKVPPTRTVNRAIAAFIGCVSALMGVGGGSLAVPTLNAFGMAMHRAVGTSAALGFLLAVPGTIGFIFAGWNSPDLPPLSFGFLSLPAILTLAPLTVLCAPIGARIAHGLDQKKLKRVFAIFLMIVGVKMLWSVFG